MLLPALAPATPSEPDTLYHNKALLLSLGLSMFVCFGLYLMRDYNPHSLPARMILLLITSLPAAVQSMLVAIRDRAAIPLLRSATHYAWKASYGLLCSLVLVFFCISFDPETSAQASVYKFLLIPILIPYAVSTGAFYFVVFARAALK